MMQYEFEKIAGREVTESQYKAFETLYNVSDMDKADFVESVREILEHIPEPPKHREIMTIALTDPLGGLICINGKFLTVRAELVDVDIARGKSIFRMEPLSADLRDDKEIEYFEDNPNFEWEGGKNINPWQK